MRLRSDPVSHATLIIAMTANAFGEDRERCLAAGMNNFIAKPFKPNKLLNAIARQINKIKQGG